MESSGLFSSQILDSKHIINLSKSGALSPTSKLKSSPTYKSSPLLKSFSSTKLGKSPEESNEEILLKRRISKLTEKQFSIILEKAIDILRKPSEKRSLEDIFYLIKTTEKLDFFARMKKDKETEYLNPNSMNFKCCKALKYEQFFKGETVFFQGDDADKFFIIIKGKVSVLLLKEQNILAKEKENLRKLRRNRKIPDYLKQYQSISSQNREKTEKNDASKQTFQQKSAETGVTPFDQGLEIKKKFQKNISKVSNALLFLKTIEKSSETTKSEALFSALFPLSSKISSESNRETPLIEKEKDSTTLQNIRLDVSEQINSNTTNSTLKKNCLIPGLNNQDLQFKDAFLDEGVFKYNLASQLKTGDAFGELGIIRKKKRAATIVCLENTHLAVLMKKDYETILLEEQTIKFKKLVDFFNKTLFKKCSNDRMTFIAYMYKKRKYIKDQWIFREEEEPNECFIVKKGDIELSKTLKQKNKRGKVAILSENQFFGEEDILKKREKRLYNAKVLSVKATVFFISKQHFNKLLSEYKDLAFLFLQQAKSKESFHFNKIEQISQIFALKSKKSGGNKRKLRKKAPIRATLDQLDFICSERKEMGEDAPFLAFQNYEKKNIILPKALRSPKTEIQQDDKNLYYKETHQYSNVVRANQKTLKALLKKKIDIFELYSETKNLHRYHELQYLNKRDRSKTQFFNEIAKERSTFTHNLQNLQNFDTACKERSDSVEFLNVFTPIRRNSDSSQNINKDLVCKEQKTSFIKTYEYFCKAGQSQIKIEPNLHYRRLSLNLKTDGDEALKDCELFLRGSSGTFKNMDSINSQENYLLRPNKNKQKNPKSIVVLNHTGRPIKFSNN